MTSDPTVPGTAPTTPVVSPGGASAPAQVFPYATVVAILLPFVALGVAVAVWGLHGSDLALLLGMHALTMFGLGVGFHRQFEQRSFRTFRWMQTGLAVLGSMAVQGSLFAWVGRRRRHLHHPEQPAEAPGLGMDGRPRSWPAQVAGMFAPDPPELERYIPDLAISRRLRLVSTLFPLWVLLGLVLPGCAGWLIEPAWVGFWRGCLWGGLARVVLAHHLPWSIATIARLVPTPAAGEQLGREQALSGFTDLGESLPRSRQDLAAEAPAGRAWRFEAGERMVDLLGWLDLAWDIRRTGDERPAHGRLGDIVHLPPAPHGH